MNLFKERTDILLKDWHRKWIVRPLLVIGGIFFLVLTLVAIFFHKSKKDHDLITIESSIKLLTNSLTTKDLKTTELALHNLLISTEAKSIFLCDQQSEIFFAGMRLPHFSCKKSLARIYETFYEHPVSGLNLRLILVKNNHLHNWHFYIACVLLAALIASFFVYLKNIGTHILRDLIQPLSNMTFASHNLSIVELQKVRSKFLKLHELELNKSMSENLIEISNQVAHDIRSPLSIIKLLVPSMSGHLESEKQNLLNNAIHRINAIAEELLERSRKNSSISAIPHEQKTSLQKLIQDALAEKIFERKSFKKNVIQFEFVDKTQRPSSAPIPEIEFSRILSNILNNAIEAMDSSKSGKIQITLEQVDNHIKVIVQDNGMGIAPKLLKKLGQKGFSSGKSHLSQSGNGLGLYHARTVLESHGAHLHIASELGRGTTLTMTFAKVTG